MSCFPDGCNELNKYVFPPAFRTVSIKSIYVTNTERCHDSLSNRRRFASNKKVAHEKRVHSSLLDTVRHALFSIGNVVGVSAESRLKLFQNSDLTVRGNTKYHLLRKLGVIQLAHHLLVTKHFLQLIMERQINLQCVHISGIAMDTNELLEIRM